MSKIVTRVEYVCQCGQDWGSCGAKSVFVSIYNCSIDLCEIYHLRHLDRENSSVELLAVWGDEELAAFSKLLDKNEHEGLPEDEWQLIKDHKSKPIVPLDRVKEILINPDSAIDNSKQTE